MAALQSDPFAYDPSKEVGVCNWPPVTDPSLASLSPAKLARYARNVNWMGYAARLNRATPGFVSDNITRGRWEALTPGYDVNIARQIGIKHDINKSVASRNVETRWYHTKTDMLATLRDVGLVAALVANPAPLVLAAPPPNGNLPNTPQSGPLNQTPSVVDYHHHHHHYNDDQLAQDHPQSVNSVSQEQIAAKHAAQDIARQAAEEAYKQAYYQSLRSQGFEPTIF